MAGCYNELTFPLVFLNAKKELFKIHTSKDLLCHKNELIQCITGRGSKVFLRNFSFCENEQLQKIVRISLCITYLVTIHLC